MTQGETPEELAENLRDIYADIRAGLVSYVRRVEELQLA
jgi:predicted RNase H-like HicB family nuclease